MDNFQSKNQHRATAAATVAAVVAAQIVASCSNPSALWGRAVREPADLRIDCQTCGGCPFYLHHFLDILCFRCLLYSCATLPQNMSGHLTPWFWASFCDLGGPEIGPMSKGTLVPGPHGPSCAPKSVVGPESCISRAPKGDPKESQLVRKRSHSE